MQNPFIIGKDIYLRGLREDDLEGDYFQWLNDRELTCYLESGYFPNTIAKMQIYFANVISRDEVLMLAIIEKNSERHIGNIKVDQINWIHRTAQLGMLIGEKDCHGKGYATQALELMLEHVFTTLNLRKINLRVIVENYAAVRLYEKMGFQIEGLMKEQDFHNGKYCDAYMMALLKKDFKKRGKSI